MTPWTLLGRIAGFAVAPVFAVGSALRGARIIHPEGVAVRAEVEPIAVGGALGDLAGRLEGPALVRLSSAAWRSHSVPDVLGCAVRFRRAQDLDPTPAGDDQDLILATIRSLWDIPTGFLHTDASDWLSNGFYGAGGYEADDVPGRLRLRLTPLMPAPRVEGDRVLRLDAAMRSGNATLRLEVHVQGVHDWLPLVAIHLRERVPMDQEALRFSPFRAGRGLRPRGFFQGLRMAAYPASQAARPAADTDPATPSPVPIRLVTPAG